MKLIDFLLHKTFAEELCVICDPWRAACVWIDHEDLFAASIPAALQRREVIKDNWEVLPVCDNIGNHVNIMAHHIYVGG